MPPALLVCLLMSMENAGLVPLEPTTVCVLGAGVAPEPKELLAPAVAAPAVGVDVVSALDRPTPVPVGRAPIVPDPISAPDAVAEDDASATRPQAEMIISPSGKHMQ